MSARHPMPTRSQVARGDAIRPDRVSDDDLVPAQDHFQARMPFLDLMSSQEHDHSMSFVAGYTQIIPYPALTLVEQQIAAVLNAVRNKRNWAAKLRESPAIRSKWWKELDGQMRERNKAQVLRYAFKELAWQAEHEPLAAGPDNVFASDSIVPKRVRRRLVKLAAKLEDVPEHKKDWHPNSNNQVLNLVHPSLYPVVYGRTCAYPADQRSDSVRESMERIGGRGWGPVYPPGEDEMEPYDERFLSTRFQWLPAEIEVDEDGGYAGFVSYINNLHPHEHGKLYGVLEEVLTSMLPLFEETLKRVDCPRPIRICTGPDFWFNSIPTESGESEQEFIGSDDDMAGSSSSDDETPPNHQHNQANHKNDTLAVLAIDDHDTLAAAHAVAAETAHPVRVDSDSNEGVKITVELDSEIDSASGSESSEADPTYAPHEFDDEDHEYPYEYEDYREERTGAGSMAPTGVTGKPEGVTSFEDGNLYTRAYERVYRPNVPRRFVPPAPIDGPTMSPGSQLAGTRLQVIVKLANIHLTPENPSYPGGSWHVEGMLNECIIATGLYYYAMDNITESQLHFRTFVQPPPVDDQQHRVFEDVFGFQPAGYGYRLCQGKGYITAHEGRAVVFPNMYQHKVFPFELEDKSRPGYRKILAFFLVDPFMHDEVVSSAMVPPQQADWLVKALVEDQGNPVSARLPVELVKMIGDEVAMTLDEAKAVRLELMAERSMNASEANELTFGALYNLCEH